MIQASLAIMYECVGTHNVQRMTLARRAAELQDRQGPTMAEDGRGNSRTRDATAACDN